MSVPTLGLAVLLIVLLTLAGVFWYLVKSTFRWLASRFSSKPRGEAGPQESREPRSEGF